MESQQSRLRIQAGQAAAHTDETVTVRGHVYALRRMGGIIFVVLRDPTGLLQLVISNSLEAAGGPLHLETPIEATGKLVASPTQAAGVELQVTALTCLATTSGALPVEISRPKRMESLSLNALLEHRPLTLRNEKVRAIFKIEAEICRAFREFLSSQGFTEIHSPKIVATGTEGGANLFKLDYFGKTAFLAQSPQFYKQIMVGVFERVFEIGPVYRAEEHNTARHLNEYVSMDFEMGFISSEQELLAMETRLLKHIFAALQANCAAELALWQASVPEITEIPQVKLAEAHEILSKHYSWQGSGDDLDPEGERLLTRHFQEKEGSELVFVTHYPWAVRPFYAMPCGQLSNSFDLLYRGLEITTGGQRIHEPSELLAAIESRGMVAEHFQDYLQCFRAGMPPHGGLAIGLERLAKQLLGLTNVREASLFPRDGNRISP